MYLAPFFANKPRPAKPKPLRNRWYKRKARKIPTFSNPFTMASAPPADFDESLEGQEKHQFIIKFQKHENLYSVNKQEVVDQDNEPEVHEEQL